MRTQIHSLAFRIDHNQEVRRRSKGDKQETKPKQDSNREDFKVIPENRVVPSRHDGSRKAQRRETEAAIKSIRSELEGIIRNWAEDVLKSWRLPMNRPRAYAKRST
jgi:hypothetical protein